MCQSAIIVALALGLMFFVVSPLTIEGRMLRFENSTIPTVDDNMYFTTTSATLVPTATTTNTDTDTDKISAKSPTPDGIALSVLLPCLAIAFIAFIGFICAVSN